MTTGPGRDDPDPRGLNGYVVLVLEERFRRPGTEDLQELARRGELPGLVAVLDGLGRPPTTPLVTGERRAQWERLEEPARPGPDTPPSLLLFWRVDLRGTGRDPEEVARDVAAQTGVRTAYAEMLVQRACRPAAASARSTASHLDPDGVGIDLDGVRGYRGGDGSGIGCVDVEEGWRLDHPALAATAPSLVSRAPLGPRDPSEVEHVRHGTGVLGVLAGADPTAGLRPIAPGCALMAASHYDTEARTDMNVHLAIGDALTALGAGGVIVLEVTRGPSGTKLPAEVDLATRSATTTAIVGHDVTVVAAAGNSSCDLDSVVRPDGFAFDRDEYDTGSILVGACDPDGRRPGGHQRWVDSNYGSRVDCHAWGAGVRTTDVDGARDDFDGTSAATAIVAGVAVVAQAMRLAATGAPFATRELRAVLAADANGTPQAGPSGKLWVGPMPDLGGIAVAVGAVPL